MSELGCKFQIPASNTAGWVAETRTGLQCYLVKIFMSFKGSKFSSNDLDQNSVSFIHIVNACQSCVASFFYISKSVNK